MKIKLSVKKVMDHMLLNKRLEYERERTRKIEISLLKGKWKIC
jgi:hypothetical protein